MIIVPLKPGMWESSEGLMSLGGTLEKTVYEVGFSFSGSLVTVVLSTRSLIQWLVVFQRRDGQLSSPYLLWRTWYGGRWYLWIQVLYRKRASECLLVAWCQSVSPTFMSITCTYPFQLHLSSMLSSYIALYKIPLQPLLRRSIEYEYWTQVELSL